MNSNTFYADPVAIERRARALRAQAFHAMMSGLLSRLRPGERRNRRAAHA